MHRLHNRRSIRLPGWDYAAPAWYSVTVCTHDRARVLGHVDPQGRMHLSPVGQLVEACLRAIPAHHPRAVLDAFVVMPDHVHLILGLAGEHVDGAGRQRAGAGSLGTVVGTWKAAVTRAARARGTGCRWQRGYYEHIVRSETALDRHRRYIALNPARWARR